MTPQLIHMLLTAGALLTMLGVLGYGYRQARLFHSKPSNDANVSRLRREVAELAGSIADLEERFSRFQKREGMRAARSEKEKGQALREEAAEIMAKGASETAPAGKLGLYTRLRSQ